MNNDTRKVQALKLIDCGRRTHLTDLASALVSRQVEALLEEGLIRHAPERWVGYELTRAGGQLLAVGC